MEKNLALDLARTNFNYSTKKIPVHGKDLYIPLYRWIDRWIVRKRDRERERNEKKVKQGN